jgi:hypothetical protein
MPYPAYSADKKSRVLKRADGSDIQYYLSQSIKSSTSLAVLLQGSDCNSVYHNALINDEFADIFEYSDILTVEKYGIDASLIKDKDPDRKDCPQSYLLNDSPQQRVADYEQVMQHLNNAKEYERVILLGGSEGAVMANVLTSISPLIDLTVSISGGARWFIDDVLHSIKMQFDTPQAFEEASTGFMGFYNHILSVKKTDIVMSGHEFL